MSYLVAVGGVQAAPAVRVGYSWASNNLRLIQTYTTMSCLLFVCVNLILGQAQLVVRSVRAARLWPTRRYPAACTNNLSIYPKEGSCYYLVYLP